MRIGPKMQQALSLCDKTEGAAVIDVAYATGPHHSLNYGYAIVNRLIRTGLVEVFNVPHRRGRFIRPKQ